MAKLNFTAKVRLVPDDETMEVILKLLNLWQDANHGKMVAMVPQNDRYVYEIVDIGDKKHEQEN